MLHTISPHDGRAVGILQSYSTGMEKADRLVIFPRLGEKLNAGVDRDSYEYLRVGRGLGPPITNLALPK